MYVCMYVYVLMNWGAGEGDSSRCPIGGSDVEMVASLMGREVRKGVSSTQGLRGVTCLRRESSVCEQTIGLRRGFLFCTGSRGVLALVSSECSLAMRTSSGSLTDSSYMASLSCLILLLGASHVAAIRCGMRSYVFAQAGGRIYAVQTETTGRRAIQTRTKVYIQPVVHHVVPNRRSLQCKGPDP